MATYDINLNDYWRIIKKKRWIVISTVFLLGTFSFIFSLMNKPTPIYRASSSVKIERNTSMTGLYMQSVSWGTGDDLATRAEEIKSYPIIEKAAQAMGALDSSLTSEEIRNNRSYFEVVAGLKRKVSTEQQGYTNIINISVTSYNPEEAMNLANALAKVYQEDSHHQRKNQNEQALKALKSQLDKARLTYKQAEREVEEYRQDNRFITIENRITQISNQLAASETKLDKLREDIKQIDNILAELDVNPEYIYYISFNLLLTHQNAVLNALQNRLNTLYSELNSYLQNYTENHPIVENQERQIENIKGRIISELISFRRTLVNMEETEYQKWKKLDKEYKSLPVQGSTISNLERELENSRELYQQLKINYQHALIKQSEVVKEVYIIKPAFLPSAPINKAKVAPITIVGTIIGVILGIVMAFISETLDTTFRTIDDIEQTLGTTVPGIIPFVDIEDIKESMQERSEEPVSDEVLEMQAKLVSHFNPKSSMAESFRALRTNVNFTLNERGYKAVMITSAAAGEGKTTVSVNLALSMAQIGLNTLLVETDLRRPRISKAFGIDKEPGISDCILRREPVSNVIRTMSDLMMGFMGSKMMKQEIPGIEYLNILTSGQVEQNPSEIIADRKFTELIEELKDKYDVIIFDSAPVLRATDAAILGSKVDGTILVYYHGKISRNTLRRANNQLERLKSDIIGVIVNGMKADMSADYADYRYRYEYTYAYGSTEEYVHSNKIIAAISSFFLRPREGLELQLIRRLRKRRLLAILAGLAAIIGGGMLISNLFREPQPKQEAKKETTEASAPEQTQTTTTVTPDTQTPVISRPPHESLTRDQTRPDISSASRAALQQLKDQYGVRSKPASTGTSAPLKPRQKQTPPKAYSSPQTKDATPPAPPASSPPARSPVRKDSRPEAARKITRATQIRSLGISRPYSIIMEQSAHYNQVEKRVAYYRNRGLQVFATLDFSNPEEKQYYICYGSFTDKSKARKNISRLKFLGFKGDLHVISLPYAIYMAAETDHRKQAVVNLPNIFSYFMDTESNTLQAEKYLLMGAFRNPEYAELFKNSRDLLAEKEIVLR